MAKCFIVLVTLLIFNVCVVMSDCTDCLESRFLDIVNDDHDEEPECDDYVNNYYREPQPTFSNGMWWCGDCSRIDDTKLLYEESLEVDTNYNTQTSLKTQIRFALNNMRCITIQTHSLNIVRRLGGSCFGNEVTLSVLSRFCVRIKIYRQ